MVVSFEDLTEGSLADYREYLITVVDLVVSVDFEVTLLVIEIVFEIYELWPAFSEVVDCLDAVDLLSLDGG